MLSKKLANFLHKYGFRSARKFTLFCFSWILERPKYSKQTKTFDFGNRITFYISSPVQYLMENLISRSLRSEKYQIGKNNIFLSSIELVQRSFYNENSIDVVSLTPIEVHRTFTGSNGKSKTVYFSPFDKEFEDLVNLNIKNKWKAFYGKDLEENVEITPLFDRKDMLKYKKIVQYGVKEKYIVEGWMGTYRLKASYEVLKFIYDAGLGSKNSQGFGFIERGDLRNAKTND